jgi:hypothetical protein
MTHAKAEIIETARLVLEPLRIEHAEPMAIVLADPQLHAFIGGAPATARQLRSRYTRMLAGPGDSAEIWCRRSSQLIMVPHDGGGPGDQVYDCRGGARCCCDRGGGVL